MKRYLYGLLTGVVLQIVFAGVCAAQIASLPPNLRRAASNPDQDAYRQVQIQRTMEAQQRVAMRQAEQEARDSAKIREVMPSVSAAEIKRIEQLLTPHPDDMQRYKAFLSLDRTGIFKLFPQSICDEARILRVDGECANSVPGGSRYSFRAGSKTPDIHYVNDRLWTKGFFALHLVANIGDVSIESLAPGDKFIKPLSDFVPGTDYDQARSQSDDIENGLALSGTTFTDNAEIRTDSTYLLRIVAYKNGNNLQRRLAKAAIALDDPIRNFEILLTDNRLDLIIAFRVIRRDDHNNLTILWREISRKKPPVITFPEDHGLADIN